MAHHFTIPAAASTIGFAAEGCRSCDTRVWHDPCRRPSFSPSRQVNDPYSHTVYHLRYECEDLGVATTDNLCSLESGKKSHLSQSDSGRAIDMNETWAVLHVGTGAAASTLEAAQRAGRRGAEARECNMWSSGVLDFEPVFKEGHR